MSPTIIIIVIAAYFAVMLAVSAMASRRSGSSEADFFNGGRSMPWFVVAVAMVGSAISGVTFISVPGMVAAKGYTYLQMVLGFIAGYVVIAAVLVPLFYKRNLLSIYGWLEERYSPSARTTGAWFFFISKILGASVRFYVVCAVLQILVFTPLGIPFWANVGITVALIWLYTFRSGVASLVWTDLIRSFSLVLSVALSIWFIGSALGLGPAEIATSVASHPQSVIFNFSDPMAATYFWKQFAAGVFMAIAMNGLDQDMMQRHLSCRDSVSSRKNMIFSGVMQFFIIALFLMLGTMLILFASHENMTLPANSDELFGLVATHPSMPPVLGILFIVGLIAAAYSAAGSALTSLTSTFTIDILRLDTSKTTPLAETRRRVHIAMAAAMALVIVAFRHINNDDAISAVYTLASYTYGPILGLFAYGLIAKGRPGGRGTVAASVIAPVASWFITGVLESRLGYSTGFELLIINASLTMAGLWLSAALSPAPLRPLTTLKTPATDNGKRSI